MALLLTGESGHHSYAPLSHGQTLSMCQALEGKIRELQSQTADLRRDLGHTDHGVSQLRSHLAATNSSTQSLQEGQNNLNVIVETLRKDLARIGTKVNKLGSGLEQTADEGKAMKDAQKVTNTNVHVLKQDIAGLHDRVNHIQVSLETTHMPDTTELKDHLQQVRTAIKALREDGERTKAAHQETKEGLRITNQSVQGLGDELTKAGTVSSTIEHRLSEALGILKVTRQQLSETNVVALKIHEDHKNTKSHLALCQEGMKKNVVHIKHVHERLDVTVTRLQNTAEQVGANHSVLGSLRDQNEKLVCQVHSLNEAQDMLNSTALHLRAHLEDTQATVQSVKAGLKETNSLVLPNLKLDGGGRPWSVMTDVPSPSSRKSITARSSKKVSPSPGGVSPGISLGFSGTFEHDLDRYINASP